MKYIKKYHLDTVLVVVIFFLGFFLRFYQFPSVPKGLYPDESAIGYNAYSILQTGRDEYGTVLPIYFRSFDDYKMPVYIYATSLAIRVFGVNDFAVRFTSALFGVITVIALYFLLLELSKKKWLATVAAFSLTLNPWHFFFSRTGYEVNLATSLIVLGTLFFVMAVGRKNNFFLFFLSIFSLLLSIYTYNVTRLVAPLIFFMLIAFYYKQLAFKSKKQVILLILLFLAGMLPLFATFVSFQSQAGFAAHDDALITGKVVKADILQTRSYFVTLPGIVQKTLFNYYVLLAWKFFGSLLAFFSTAFFFLVGADHPHENIGGFGMFYYFDFPLIVFGAYQGLRKKITYLYPFYWWFVCMLFVGGIIVAIPGDNAFGTRAYAAVIPLVVFSSYGLYRFIQIVVQYKHLWLKRGIFLLSSVFIVYSYLFYFTSYFVRFPVEYAKQWHSEDQQTVEYIRSIEHNYNKIVFDDSAEFLYTSLLFYGEYPPRLHQQQATYRLKGLVNTLVTDGKYEFRKVDFQKEMHVPGTLFVTGGNNLPENVRPIAIFTYPTRPVVLFYDRTIGQFPTTDIAYEIFQSGDK